MICQACGKPILTDAIVVYDPDTGEVREMEGYVKLPRRGDLEFRKLIPEGWQAMKGEPMTLRGDKAWHERCARGGV